MLKPPVTPMEARSVDAIPEGPEWQYEPKWDGFRCIAFRDCDAITLQSKAGKPLTRYFPDVVASVRAIEARRCVLDGEIVVPQDGAFSFDALLQRIHPAKSRIEKLARETPALLIAFDLLADAEGRALLAMPLRERRPRLEAFAAHFRTGVRLSPATTRLSAAKGWLNRVGTTLDGIIAKRIDMTYRSGERDGMQKIKHRKTADCVVGGFRYAEGKKVVGSLLLGLYDDQGLLNHCGFTSSFKAAERKSLTEKIEPLIGPPGFTGSAPGGPSRWSTKRSMEWQPLKPKLVVEVEYDHFTGDRFRHGTQLLRWRPDKAPRQCTFEQVAGGRGASLKLLK